MHCSFSLRTFLLWMAFVLSFGAIASAQVVVPEPARPDAAQRQFRVIERPQVGGAPVITLPDEGVDKILDGGTNFELKEVIIEGATAIPAANLRPLYSGLIGNKVTLGALRRLVADISAYYRNEGFILSRAVLPPQRVSGGTVRIAIIEGFINSVQLQGDVDADSILQSYARELKESKPLNAKQLERYLLLMEDTAGVTARAVLQPAAGVQGASDVIVTIQRRAVQGAFTLDNRGSRFLGPVQGGASFATNNLLTLDEQLEVRAINSILDSSELMLGQIRGEFPIGSEGTKLSVLASHVGTDAGHTIRNLDVQGQARTYSASITHPFIRSRKANLFGTLQGNVRDIDARSLGNKLYEDRLRTVSAGGAYDFTDSWMGVNRMDAAVTKGFGWDTDSDNNTRSRANGRPNFWKVGGEVSRLQAIDGPWAAFAAVSGQLSADPLLAPEEFALGGAAFGSGYDTAEVTGDSGLATRLELQYNESYSPDFLPQYQFYGFYDVGRVWNQNVNKVAGDRSRDSLASAGVGTRFDIIDPVSANLELAFPLTRNVAALGTDGDAPRLFFGLQYRY